MLKNWVSIFIAFVVTINTSCIFSRDSSSSIKAEEDQVVERSILLMEDRSQLVMEIQTPKVEFKSGEPIFVTFLIENHADSDVHIRNWMVNSFLIPKTQVNTVNDVDNKRYTQEVSKTLRGKRTYYLPFGMVGSDTRINLSNYLLIPPHKKIAMTTPIPINLYYDMTMAGKYTITTQDFHPIPYAKENGEFTKLTSNTLEIEVLDEVFAPDVSTDEAGVK